MSIAVVGQRIDLTAAFGQAEATNVTWTFLDEAAAAAVKSYTSTEKNGVVMRLQAEDLNKVNLVFHWIRQGQFRIGLKCDQGESVEEFTVVGPTNVSMTSATWRVGIGLVSIGFDKKKKIFSPHLQFGDEAQLKPGIVWTCACTAPAQYAGFLRCTQLIRVNRIRNLDAGGPLRFRSDGFVLDEVVGYDIENPKSADDPLETVKVEAGSAASFTCQDSPGSPLSRTLFRRNELCESYELDEQFRAYLMFKPSIDRSIWVTLARLDWSYRGKAVYDSEEQAWNAVDCANSMNPAGVESSELPVWLGNKEDVEWL